MIPENLRTLSDSEPAKFIEDSKDPLIQEMVRRLEGLEFQETIRDLESQIDSYETQEHDCSAVENDLKDSEERVTKLEELLKLNDIEIPA